MAINSEQQQVTGQALSRARLVRGGLWTAAVVVALVVVVGVGGVLLVSGMAPSALGPGSSRLQDAGFVVSAIALVVLVVAAVVVARAGPASAGPWFLAPSSTRTQRAQALRSVRDGRAVEEPAMALTTAVAGAAARQGRGALLWVAIALVLAGGALGTATWWQALTMAAVAALLVLAAITARDAGRARRWLDAHGQNADAIA